jgi:hypothetical protein
VLSSSELERERFFFFGETCSEAYKSDMVQQIGVGEPGEKKTRLELQTRPHTNHVMYSHGPKNGHVPQTPYCASSADICMPPMHRNVAVERLLHIEHAIALVWSG